MNTKSIQERLMLVRLTLSQWYPRKFDKSASDELARLHGKASAEDMGRFNKILVDSDSLKDVRAAMSELKTKHYAMTAPWTDEGVRVLPSDLYFEYVEMARAASGEIERLARYFAHHVYPAQVAAAPQRLAGLFDAADYPDADEVARRFRCAYRFEPIANPEDVRVWGLNDQAAGEIRAELERSIRETTAAAQRHVFETVLGRAREFCEKIERYESGESTRLYETAISNVTDIIDLVLRGLNIDGDPELSKLASDLNSSLRAVSIEELKETSLARRSKLKEVQAITNRFAGIYGA